MFTDIVRACSTPLLQMQPQASPSRPLSVTSRTSRTTDAALRKLSPRLSVEEHHLRRAAAHPRVVCWVAWFPYNTMCIAMRPSGRHCSPFTGSGTLTGAPFIHSRGHMIVIMLECIWAYPIPTRMLLTWTCMHATQQGQYKGCLSRE